MTPTPLSPTVKALLDYGPVVAFLAGYMLLRDDVITIGGQDYGGFIVVTAIFVPLLLLSTATLWWLTGKVSRMQVVTAVLVIVFGGLTVWLNDERFFKMKPTIVFGLFALILGFGLWRGQSYLAWVMSEMLPLQHDGWMILTRRFAVFFVILALVNEVIWRFLSTDLWVLSDTFGQPIALFVFFLFQVRIFEDYKVPEEET